MSRTIRNADKAGFRVYRHPKTFNEVKQLETLLHDDEVTLRNRDKSKITNLPTAYFNVVCSGFFEDYNWKHHWYI